MILNFRFQFIVFLSIIYLQIGSAQVVKGKLIEKNSFDDLAILTIIEFEDQNSNKIQTTSDFDGEYRITLKNTGMYKVSVIDPIKYYTLDTTVFVKNDTLQIVNFSISVDTMKILSLPFTITEKPYKSGDLTMTQNQYKVMPASFQDPARILIKYPGFSTPNDGANAIIFRGMPPESARWQLFGADIVNPNHLSNAGTANDLATGNAGGVNAMSGSVLDYYHFEANPADISYANVMSGVSNMKMAPKIKSFVDINLIGLEAGLGMSRGNKNVYAAYRYSFVGLLDKLGVNFGNEKIGYQDLSMYADLIKKDHHSFKLFSTLGKSSNVFTAVERGDSLTRFKDIQHITYESELVIGGAQYTYEKANKYFQSTIIMSGRNDKRVERTDAFYIDSLGLSLSSDQRVRERLLSWHNQYILDYSGAKMTFGLRTNMKDDGRIVNGFDEPVLNIYPYLQYKSDSYKPFNYHIGIGSFYENRTKEVTVEPSLGASYKLSRATLVSLDYRLSSFQDFTSGQFSEQVYERKRIKAHNFQTGIQYIQNNLQIRSAIFLHQFWDISTFASADGVGHFTPFNGSNLGYDQVYGFLSIVPNGTSSANVLGGELYLENKSFIKQNSLNYSINLSIFDSKYNLNNKTDQYYNGRYNFGYTSNANVSYSVDISKSNKDRSLIISLSNHLRGAMREQSLNPVNGKFSTLYNVNSPYDQKFRPYQRIDFRVVYTSQKFNSNKTHRWSLDIQNVLNRENDGFRYYDPLLNSVLLQKQLGLVPVLSYRLEW